MLVLEERIHEFEKLFDTFLICVQKCPQSELRHYFNLLEHLEKERLSLHLPHHNQHQGISMESLPHNLEVFPNRMKLSGFANHSGVLKIDRIRF